MAQPGAPEGVDPLLGFAVTAMVCLLFVGVLWLYMHTQVNWVVMTMRSYEMYAMAWASTHQPLSWVLPAPFVADLVRDANEVMHFVRTSDPDTVKFGQLWDLSSIAGKYVRWPITLVLIIVGFWIMFTHPGSRFNRVLNMKGLMAFQSEVWPMIRPIVKEDPLVDKAKHWREALSPEEWIREYKIELIESAPDREGTRTQLARQLARPWSGPRKLQPHVRALCAAFALKSARKNNECRDLLADLSRGWANHGSVSRTMAKNGKLSRQVEKILSDPKLGGVLLAEARRHAFVETAMASFLLFARKQGGVLASAEFLWLRAEDRSLWYIMNGVGRLTYHIEAAGAIAHWKAETAADRPLPEADVDEAVFGLEEFLAR